MIIARLICLIYVCLCGISLLNAEDTMDIDSSKNLAGKHLDSNIVTAHDDRDDKDRFYKDNKFLFGNVDLLSADAPESIKRVSGEVLEKTGFSIIINIVDNVSNGKEDLQPASPVDRFNARREYENAFIEHMHGNYAVVFLFYKEHAITIRTNADFIDTQDLLENYAYPYLPAERIGGDKYKNGVNEGLSNLYLALSHTIADYYGTTLSTPKPMERPGEATKVIIYAMLIVLIVLFLLVSNGFFKKGRHEIKR